MNAARRWRWVSGGVLGLLAGLAFSSGAQAQQTASAPSAQQQTLNQILALNWQKAGAVVPLSSVATLSVPDKYAMLAPPDAQKFLELNHDLSGPGEYILMPYSMGWFAVLSYENTGFIKDDEQLDADKLLSSMVTATQQSNEQRKARGWDTLSVQGWSFPPQYNRQTHRLEWAFLDRDDTSGADVVNYNTRILGRSGVMDVLLVADPDTLQASMGELNTALENFSYDPGQHYSEFRQGDRVAEFGLGALIVGGAAAVAAHKGVFAGLLAGLAAAWKVAVAAVVAGLAGVRRFFRGLFSRKKS